MPRDKTAYMNKFMESERIFIELSSQALNRIRFLHLVSNQFKLISDCDALEMRIFDREFHYKWSTNFSNNSVFEETEFSTDDNKERLPILNNESALEEICRNLFLKRFDPLLNFEYSLNSRYIEDTSAAINLKINRKEISLSVAETGFKSILLLPFTMQDNPPGLLILYSNRIRFIDKSDIPAYEDLMHSLSIALKFRRTMHALNERIKELSCLYEINQIYQDYTDEPQTLLTKIVEHIPLAFQYPEAACAEIVIDEARYFSPNFVSTDNCLKNDIIVDTKQVGLITVYYPDYSKTEEPMHFLPEEKQLLEIIAQKISMLFVKMSLDNEKKAMEEQLRHADRLATVGQLGSGIAHELNDPLANILGYAQLLLKSAKDPAQISDLERIVRSSLHAREIVRKLLLFARQMPTQKTKVSINKIITDTIDLLKSRFDQGKVKITLDLHQEIPSFMADPSQMTQVVTNLCVNALQAMPQGGNINISTLCHKGNIVLNISDSGNGIKKEQLDKIFLPFYTTKPVGIGTGLGLSVVHGIVTSHQGSIEVKSKAGKGSKFTVTFPINPASGKKEKVNE